MLKILSLLALLLSCTKTDVPDQLSLFGKTMGTTFSIKYYPAKETPDSEELLRLVNEKLISVNMEMSTYIDQSEIQKFNKQKTLDSWFKVSPGFHWVTKLAVALAEKTDGIYDPTVGPLVDLWGFGKNKTKTIPSAQEIEKAKQMVGYKKIIIHDTEAMIRKTQADVRLDLSSIAKGWGVDEVGRVLESHGIESYMVEIGGEIRAKGLKPDKTQWQLGITSPDSKGFDSVQKIVLLKDAALATSGDYRNFYEIDGKRYSHVIDPRTGSPALSTIASVSVIEKSGDCTQADGLATALLAMGLEGTQKFALDNQLPVFIVYHSGEEEYSEWMTPEFSGYIKKK